MKFPDYVPRLIQRRLEVALTDTPVVLIHGPRQCGKTTLARRVGADKGYAYVSFDDRATVAAAREDPDGYVASLPDKVVIDEVQRAPDLFAAIKLSVDRERTPGRFILTGSSNILTVPRLSDSLAGRVEIIRLHPLSCCEMPAGAPGFLEDLFSQGDLSYRSDRLGGAIADLVTAGGFPAALARADERRRTDWYRDYVETITQRDVRELARIRSLEVLPQLLGLAAAQTAQLFKLSEISGPFQLSRPTIGEYLTLLERVFLIYRLAPWYSNRVARLLKMPKLHMVDTGVACSLLGQTRDSLLNDRSLLGRLLETFVVQELMRQASWTDDPVRFHHLRHKDGAEVDLVLERGAGRVAGIEVKLSGTVTARDFRGLKKLQEIVGERFVAGVVLFDGETTLPFGDRLHAVPLKRVWNSV